MHDVVLSTDKKSVTDGILEDWELIYEIISNRKLLEKTVKWWEHRFYKKNYSAIITVIMNNLSQCFIYYTCH